MIAFLLATALAGGLHAGVDPARVSGLGRVVYMAPEAGWSAPLADESGSVRVFVGRGDTDAAAFYEAKVKHRSGVAMSLGDVSLRDGNEAFVRDGNLVVAVRAPDAQALVTRVLGRATGFENWPPIPEVVVSGRNVRVNGSWAAVLLIGGESQAIDGTRSRTHIVPTGLKTGRIDGTLDPSSIEVTAWDKYGRLVVTTWLDPHRPAVQETEAPVTGPLAIPVD
ncbi:MAG: hypothetical protein KC912_03370 [Proteobacteria bacterium]|nr:hypothetical protein [Pseudomonadota bacterium]